MTSKQQRLDQIAAEITSRNVCPNLAQTATQLVMGDGNANADVVFIGEAPGKNEDLQGKPFVGASGKFLDEMLATLNMSREDIYITNIVKYRPPNNRDPSPDEKKEFWPYLLRQLAVIQPKVVVTLGRHSMGPFLPDMKIGQVHGQPKRRTLLLPKSPDDSSKRSSEDASQQSATQIIFLPLYHPAAALYNGSMRQTLIDDFSVIASLI